jgi:3-phosphoshikimate 1-carboxyvinyltransferase
MSGMPITPSPQVHHTSDVTIHPIDRAFMATIRPPGSKSLTNRALVLAAMCQRTCTLSNVLFADDTRVMLAALQQLGFELTIDEPASTVTVHGKAGKVPVTQAALFCGNSGTTIRFLTALCALGDGSYQLDGIDRMRQRPIGQLVELLGSMGGKIEYVGQAGFPPVRVHAQGMPGGVIQYPSAASSQYLSAVLMVSPYAQHEVHVDLIGEQTSWPYVWMTMRLMDQFGITPELTRDPSTGAPQRITVPQGTYTATSYAIEPDASNAAYFLAIAALHPGSSVTVPGLGTQSLQGDVEFCRMLKRMGAAVVINKDSVTVTGTDQLRGVDVNLLDMPDQAQTLAVVALFASGQTILRGLHTLRLKETDRLTALSNELQKFGAAVNVQGDDTLIINPPEQPRPAAVDTYDDHRMAMSFAMAGTRIQGVVIRDARCVNKTFPEYFKVLSEGVNQS